MQNEVASNVSLFAWKCLYLFKVLPCKILSHSLTIIILFCKNFDFCAVSWPSTLETQVYHTHMHPPIYTMKIHTYILNISQFNVYYSWQNQTSMTELILYEILSIYQVFFNGTISCSGASWSPPDVWTIFSSKQTSEWLKNTMSISTFVSRISPITGRLEWIAQDDNYDYHQEIAR